MKKNKIKYVRIGTHFALVMSLMGIFQISDAYAHALDQGYIFLRIEDTRLYGHVDVTISDLNSALGLSMPTDHSMKLSDLAPHMERISDYFAQHVRLSVNGGLAKLPLTDYVLTSLPIGQYLQLNFSFDNLTEEPRQVDTEYSFLFDINPEHRGMLVIESYWKAGTFDNEAIVSLIFEPGLEKQTLDLSSSSKLQGFIAQVRMGTHHIWIGIDHILFLLALLLPAALQRKEKTWQPVPDFKSALIHVVKIVTVFTVAHTLTLSFATLSTAAISSRTVESVIAISIAIAALDIIVPIFRNRIWWIVFAFGLFHGFGFASVLSSIGIPSKYMVHSLLGFNLGVEIGQVAIVLVIFPILYFLRLKWVYARIILPGAAACLIAISLYWFTERALLIDLPAGAIVNSLLGLVQ